MITVRKLLNRIRWDKTFSEGHFALGYFDRVENRIKIVPFEKIHFDRENKYVFRLVDSEDRVHSIPFHRVKEIYRNGELIWQRTH